MSDGHWEYVYALHDSLSEQGLDVEAFSRGVNLIQAREILAFTREENEQWNESRGDERLYPVDPGPTLLVIGDANPEVVRPLNYSNPIQCQGGPCHSYILVADLDNDLIPDCPVEVVPASSVTESRNAAVASADFNRGRFVDAGERVLLVAGDREEPAQGAPVPWIKRHVLETDTAYSAHQMAPSDPIIETDYPFPDHGELQIATCERINDGIAEGWMFGSYTNALHLPAQAMSNDCNPVHMTKKQRIALFVPGCKTGAVWWPDSALFGNAPKVEQLAFNDLQKTVLAGGVFNLDTGYDIKHIAWAEILRDARLNALPGTPISRIHYDAVQAWFDQFPGDPYALSTYALGAYAKPADVATGVEAGDGLPSGTGPFRTLQALGNVGSRPIFSFGLGRESDATLRIFDVSGREVTRLRSGRLPAGPHQYTWFGKDRTGTEVASGVYFGVLTTNDGRKEVAKVVIVR